eukprot:CAMPEP_0176397424 /NCGR_PEP_ID=MMETSP0126-20121128/45116_1 /TAXON_ID=141414 ORGANISM="Strombidinopsis acuminatum, Strain SPMC142" /NCGR_SAMPLE_ID=MMETSP0126 /ASSEMBLY_ACC=CAM_ASM_000229 /LENGTH=90 /DNA_ID=CAMNT_0017771731 /DNA_START=266 /DNA_END=538 /DNA_ORIENTATION=-
MALISVMRSAYQEEILQKSKDHIKENIKKAKTDQKATSTANAGLENETQFGVAKPKQNNNDEEHMDGQLFSCGSLAPKLKRGGGCMDHGF